MLGLEYELCGSVDNKEVGLEGDVQELFPRQKSRGIVKIQHKLTFGSSAGRCPPNSLKNKKEKSKSTISLARFYYYSQSKSK